MKTLKKAFPIIALLLLVAGAFSPTVAAIGNKAEKTNAQTAMAGGTIASIFLIAFGASNFANVSKENPGGLRVIGYYGLIDDFTAFPSLALNPTTDALAATLGGTFTAGTGVGFQTVYATQGTGQYESDGSGEPDTSGFENKQMFFVPGLDEPTVAFIRRVRSGKGIYIAVTRDGQRRVHGSVDYPCYASKITEKSGAKIKDRRGFEVELTSEDLVLPFYTGAIPLNDGTSVPALV